MRGATAWFSPRRALGATLALAAALATLGPAKAPPTLLRTLHWTGVARIEAGGRVVNIATDTITG